MPTSTEIFHGRQIIRSPITALLASTTLSSGSSNVNSSTFISLGYRKALAYLTISDTGSTAAATTVQFIPQFSNTDTGGLWFNYQEGVWASMVFGAAQIQSSTFRRVHTLPLDGRRIRFNVERSTTVAGDFTVAIDLEAQD